ncbi:MAG: 50S ribosomal protein L4 [Waddliaceae bacterium]
MTALKKYNLKGEEIGEINVDQRFVEAKANRQMVKDYIVALRENARQWSASTKGRSEVKHTTKKPHRQKGTGRARQGSLVSPQFRGGGIVFGPKPKFDQHVRINKKEKRSAIRYLVSEKIKHGLVKVVDSFAMEAPKTKAIAAFLEKFSTRGRVLFLGNSKSEEIEVEGKNRKVNVHTDEHHNFLKSARNLQKVEFALASSLNGYDLALADQVIITEEGLKQITEWLCE